MGTFKSFFNSPIGVLILTSDTHAIRALQFGSEDKLTDFKIGDSPAVLQQAHHQLRQYFLNERRSFSLPLDPSGTDFQQKVWNEIQKIPYGKTTTYSDLSIRLGKPAAVRAIGRANGQNPIPLIIPCHRIIGSNQKLTGYSGGIARKQWLLRHEGALLL